MVLVFILCVILIIIALIIFMTILSTIKLQVEKLEISNLKKNSEKISNNYQFNISVYLFNKIKWFTLKFNNKKIQKIVKKMKIDKLDLKKLEQSFKMKDLNYTKILSPKIAYLKLGIKVGVEDIAVTTFMVFAISTAISILLPYIIKKYEKDKYYYQVIPLYINKNAYEIKLDCIIEIEMVHIINIIYVFLKKRRVDSNERRTSNRRTYGYSYE